MDTDAVSDVASAVNEPVGGGGAEDEPVLESAREDLLDQSLEEEQSIIVEKKIIPKKVFSEQILFTKEQWEAREVQRLGMSQCCKEEAWMHYRNLTYQLRPNDRGYRPMSVLYDPEIDKKRIYMGKRYNYMEKGFFYIKEAPSKPYIRPQPPRDMDMEGRHKWQPCCLRIQMPEHDVPYIHPQTVSGKGKTLKIFNTLFKDDEILRDEESQTWRQDAVVMSRRWGKKKEWVTSRDVENEVFDLEDYPLDEDGNPIGKSTGRCEWCDREILPYPLPSDLRYTWDKDRLYCCDDYKQFCQEAAQFETDARAKLAAENRLIDIRPGNKRDKLPITTTSQDNEINPVAQRRKAYAREAAKRSRTLNQLKKVLAIEETEKLEAAAAIVGTKAKRVDTHDLPWDPYQTRYGHPRFFNDEIFDEKEFHMYPHSNISESQSGIYQAVTTESFIPGGEQISSSSGGLQTVQSLNTTEDSNTVTTMKSSSRVLPKSPKSSKSP